MYAVSFRIPFTVMGMKQYVNGSLCSLGALRSGDTILVKDKRASLHPCLRAEVLQSASTSRVPESFRWYV